MEEVVSKLLDDILLPSRRTPEARVQEDEVSIGRSATDEAGLSTSFSSTI